MLLSRGCEYGLQAVLYLASLHSNEPILQRDIAKALQIPNHFLGKILQLLVKNGILFSFKGKTGGFALARNPEEIFPWHIVEAIDGEHFLSGCVIGFPGCGQQEPCPLHPHWKTIKEKILVLFQEHNVAELSKNLSSKLANMHENSARFCHCEWPKEK